jgi:hypothetical protein
LDAPMQASNRVHSDAQVQASNRVHSQGIRGLVNLKWLRVCGTLVTREGATSATTCFPALCCVEFGSVAFPERLVGAGDSEGHDRHANTTDTVIAFSRCAHIAKVCVLHSSRFRRDQITRTYIESTYAIVFSRSQRGGLIEIIW